MALHAARVIRQRHKADEEPPSDITPGQRKNLEDAFEAADKNGDGVLTADEYFEIFQTHGLTIGKHYLLLYFLRHCYITIKTISCNIDEISKYKTYIIHSLVVSMAL